LWLRAGVDRLKLDRLHQVEPAQHLRPPAAAQVRWSGTYSPFGVGGVEFRMAEHEKAAEVGRRIKHRRILRESLAEFHLGGWPPPQLLSKA
jgi:hypothetical protein